METEKNIPQRKNTGCRKGTSCSLVTMEEALSAKTAEDLWVLAKIADDAKDEPLFPALLETGARIERKDANVYGFELDGLHYVYFPGRKPGVPLRIALPAICSMSDGGTNNMQQVLNEANTLTSCVKFMDMDGDVWMLYEHQLTSTDSYREILRYALSAIENGLRVFRSLL